MKSFPAAVLSALVLALSAGSAYADLSCPGLSPRPFSVIQTEIDLRDGSPVVRAKDIDCQKIAVGAKVVSGIQQMLGRDLAAPSSLIFRMVDRYDNAFFDPREISLNVPYQLVLGSYSKAPVYSIAIWAHEFGHAILDQVLRDAAPKWRAFIKRRLAPSAGPSADVLEAMISPYHEFFADVIAVLYTGKGDSVARGLHMTGFVANPEGSPSECANRSNEKCRPRNSSADVRGLSTNRDFLDRKNQLGTWRGVKPGDDHNLLAPARYHIWKYYLSNAEIKYQKGRMAAAAVDAIMSDLNGRLKRISSMPEGFTPANINREMADVQRINKEFIDVIDATYKKLF